MGNTPQSGVCPVAILTDSPLNNSQNLNLLKDISGVLEQLKTEIGNNLTKITNLGKQFSNARYNANIVKRELKKLDDTWEKRKKEDKKKTSRVSNFRVNNLTEPYKKLFENSNGTRYSSENKNIFASKTESIHDEQIKKLATALKDCATNSGTIEKALFSVHETLTNTLCKLSKTAVVISNAQKKIENLSKIPNEDSFINIINFLHEYIEGNYKIENPKINFGMK